MIEPRKRNRLLLIVAGVVVAALVFFKAQGEGERPTPAPKRTDDPPRQPRKYRPRKPKGETPSGDSPGPKAKREQTEKQKAATARMLAGRAAKVAERKARAQSDSPPLEATESGPNEHPSSTHREGVA